MEKKASFQKSMRRVIVRNYAEQAKLEKLRKYLDKSKTLKMTDIQRSQMDTILRLCDTQGVDLQELCSEELVAAEERKRRCESHSNKSAGLSPRLSLSAKPQENREMLMLVKRFSQSSMSSASSSSATSRISTKCFLPEVEKILERKRQLERSRTWPQSRSLPKKEILPLSTSALKSGELSQQAAVRDLISSSLNEGVGYKEDAIPEETKREKPLNELLPPIELPPLQLQRTTTLYDQNKAREKKTELTKEELWKDLEDCRYLRPYLKSQLKPRKN